ncbi:MAG: hypothetical protein ACR2HG_10720 [Pyrinomonadaceae bacterium]
MKRFKVETAAAATDEEKEIIESLLSYPSLEKVFDRNQPRNLAETKRRMLSTVAELERVVRSGTKTDAAKASKIAAAYQTAIDFLDELERLRKKQSE